MPAQLPITDPTTPTGATDDAPAPPSTGRRTSAEERRREIGRRGVAQARAALAEARLRAVRESQQRAAEQEAALLGGRSARRASSHRAA